MRVLVTRAEKEAANLGGSLEGIGCTPILAPMMEIKLHEDPIDLSGIQGIVATSANAARALAQMTDERDISLYCIGPATEKAANEVGFTNTVSSIGTLSNLVAFVQKNANPKAGPILYVHGDHVSGNPVQELRGLGFQVGARRVYGAQAIDHLTDEARAEFEKETPPEVVTFFSIRTFKLFLDVMKKEGLTGKLKDSTAVCISPAVADFARGVRWKKVISASEPNGLAVLNVIKELKESQPAAQ